MNKETLLSKIRSVKLCMMAHPDNTEDSEFSDRISDLEKIEEEYETESPKVDGEEGLYNALEKGLGDWFHTYSEKEYDRFFKAMTEYASIKCAELEKRIEKLQYELDRFGEVAESKAEELEKEKHDLGHRAAIAMQQVNDLTLENERLRGLVVKSWEKIGR